MQCPRGQRLASGLPSAVAFSKNRAAFDGTSDGDGTGRTHIVFFAIFKQILNRCLMAPPGVGRQVITHLIHTQSRPHSPPARPHSLVAVICLARGGGRESRGLTPSNLFVYLGLVFIYLFSPKSFDREFFLSFVFYFFLGSFLSFFLF